MATYKPAEARNKLGEQIATPIIDVTGDSTYVVESSTISDDGKILATPIINVTEMATPIETDPVWESEKANYALKSEVNNLIDGIEVGDTITNNTLSITGNQLTSTITTDKDTFTSQVTIPGGGGASNYFEADLSGTTFPLTLDTSLTTIGNTSTPFTGNGNSDYSLNIQGTFSRVGGNAADDVVQLQIVTNGGYMTLIDVNFNVQRNTTKFPFSYHTKKYNFGGAPTYLKIGYTGSGTVTIDSLAFWVE